MEKYDGADGARILWIGGGARYDGGDIGLGFVLARANTKKKYSLPVVRLYPVVSRQ